MSEPLAGVPAPPAPMPWMEAAAVVLFRRADTGGVEVFWLEREQKLRFAGGHFAFPGGKVEPADSLIPVLGAAGAEARFMVTAARELFEETGVLKARGAERLAPLSRRTPAALLSQTVSFRDSFQGMGSRCTSTTSCHGPLDDTAALPVGFDALLPGGGPWAQGSGLKGGWWRRMDRSRQPGALGGGDGAASPACLHALQVMAGFTDAPARRERSGRRGSAHFQAERIELQRGVMLYSSSPHPSAGQHQRVCAGHWRVCGGGPWLSSRRRSDRLVHFSKPWVLRVSPQGGVLTHHHTDHVGGASRLADALGCRCGHTSERPIALGSGDAHLARWELISRRAAAHAVACCTPGHARGHLTLVDELARRWWATWWRWDHHRPTGGEMAEYLRQLARLHALPRWALYPAHGLVIPDGPEARGIGPTAPGARRRCWAIAAFGKPTELSQVVPRAYDDVVAFVWPIAERNTEAIVEKLVAEGRVIRDGPVVSFEPGDAQMTSKSVDSLFTEQEGNTVRK